MAFTLANAITYVDAALRAGLELDRFAPRLSFFFNVHNHFLEEVAKFRAARRLWAKTMRFRFGARNPKSWLLRFHAQTAGSTLTAQQPEVNTVRVALQALAAVMGGAQSLHTNSRDEALSLPTEEAARLALQTQQVIAWESGAADIADSLGGAYALESLTNTIEEKSQEYLDRIEAMGGMLSAISSGFIQREIQQAAYEHQKAIESGERVIVGVNRFESDRDNPIPLHRLDPAIEASQVSALQQMKSARAERCREADARRLGKSRGWSGEPHASDPSRRRSLCHRGRNLRPTAPSIWRAQGKLAGSADVPSASTAAGRGFRLPAAAGAGETPALPGGSDATHP